MTDALADLRARRDYECRLTPDRALESLTRRMASCGNGVCSRVPPTARCRACMRRVMRTPIRQAAGLRELASHEVAVGPRAIRVPGRALAGHPSRQDDPAERRAARARRSGLPCRAGTDGARRSGLGQAAGSPGRYGTVRRRRRRGRARTEAQGAPGRCARRCSAAGRWWRGRSCCLRRSGEGHIHRSELARWDQAYPRPSGLPRDIVALMGAALRAAVLTPEKDLVKWFSWRWLLPSDLADQLIARGLAIRPLPAGSPPQPDPAARRAPVAPA